VTPLTPRTAGQKSSQLRACFACGHSARRRAVCLVRSRACGPQMVPWRAARSVVDSCGSASRLDRRLNVNYLMGRGAPVVFAYLVDLLVVLLSRMS
jgi:hypothetical protein